MELSVAAAMLVGLMGAGHCFGMCGGLVGALSSQVPRRAQQSQMLTQLQFQGAYHGGRLLSYALA
ncbi:MAG: sulfite exporter TauE/SafE family protein, partial [Shewanella sp.]